MPRIARVAVLSESGLVLVAAVLGLLIGVDPFATLRWSVRSVGIGLVATIPPVAAMWWIDRSSLPPLRRLRAEVDRTLRPLFASCRLVDILAIGLAAGIGEEVLFRGLAQAAVGIAVTPLAGLVVASVLFAVLHLVTPTYAVLAGLMGAYLGWVFLATGTLLAPIVVHAAYDVVALAWWLRREPEPAGP